MPGSRDKHRWHFKQGSVTELNAMVEAVNEEAVTPQEKLGNSVYRFDREAQRLEKAVEQAEKLDFEPGMSPVFS